MWRRSFRKGGADGGRCCLSNEELAWIFTEQHEVMRMALRFAKHWTFLFPPLGMQKLFHHLLEHILFDLMSVVPGESIEVCGK